jgi:Phosphate-selective porin O and P
MNRHMLSKAISLGIVTTFFSSMTIAETSVEDLVRRLEVMQQEMDELRQQLKNTVSKEEVNEVKQTISAASEWRQPDTLIHMAGYADVGYTDSESADGSFNVGTFSPIFHFQYRDIAMLESELELKVGDDGETETTLEYLTIDWFLNDYMALVAGKFLSPIGQFRQNLHPSWINKLPSSPPGFGHDGAAPVSDVGFQLRGGFPIGSVRTNYAIFASNGPELKTELDGTEYELDGVEAEGFGADRDGEKTYGARLGIIPVAGFEFGLSAATGKATVTSVEDGDSSLLSGEGARDYDVIGADFNWQINAFNLRGEYIETEVGADTGSGTAASEGSIWETWYTQGTYRLSQSKWELVARYTDFDSPHDSKDQKQWALGVNYLVTNNFIAKLGHEFNNGMTDTDADEDRLLFQLAYGF